MTISATPVSVPSTGFDLGAAGAAGSGTAAGQSLSAALESASTGGFQSLFQSSQINLKALGQRALAVLEQVELESLPDASDVLAGMLMGATEGGKPLPMSTELGGAMLPSALSGELGQTLKLALSQSGSGGGITDFTAFSIQRLDPALAAAQDGVDTLAQMISGASVEALDTLVDLGGDLSDSLAALNARATGLGAPQPLAQNTLQQTLSGMQTLADIRTPVGQHGWDQALGERLSMMVAGKLQKAEIHLHPAELGPIEIKLSVHNDQASVSFAAGHALTRDALEAAIPRLRDMLAEQNLSLVNVDVRQQDTAAQGQASKGEGDSGTGEFGSDGSVEGADGLALGPSPATRRLLGLVDDYA